MPAMNGTGPQGQGPMSGRGLGPCGQGMGWRGKSGFGGGWRQGFSRGMGKFFGWNLPQSKVDQKQSLANYKKALEDELEVVKKEEEDLNKAE